MAKFDLYLDGKIVQSNIDSPVVIKKLKPNTEYDKHVLTYAGEDAATGVSFKTKTQPVTSVSLDKTELSVEEAATAQLKATVAPSNATNKEVTWKSGSPETFTIDANGKITGVKAGQATAVATTDDGAKTAEATVTVTAKPAESEAPAE
ncbi:MULTISPECIES: Ig-like domain-containing protein [Weissella]|uniref:BIG2 domain-containing protein n=1 Tax=Weissella thailandensis TaxID=89061 RepID=A0ABX9I520_9LACO|nr:MULTISPECIES: Ig-like domain-containing protein [Weissella]NKY90865.1 Ig domain-containing protein [Weissella thailandensis]RDS59632.1 hypothetical protein DWV05_04725 [Weissella thailandensis]GEP75462.1 hypothetical protein WTH01_17090 [Weissella thailandensis]